ncbi:MAG: glycosyltransferase [Candidatus Hydrogenedentes bacterium]|nr:glycosyltransferase [Candidatus Hydrogenedentota bacterium]
MIAGTSVVGDHSRNRGKRDVDYRIAFFTNTYLPFISGVSMSVELYQQHLRAAGARVMIYAPVYREESEDSEFVRRIASISDFNHSGFSLPFPISTKPSADFRQEDFDLVHVHHPFLLGELGLQYAREERIPLVFTYHTQYERYTHYVPINEETATRTIINQATEFCNLCDLVIAPTQDIKKQIRGRGVESRIAVLPSGVNMQDYRNAQAWKARETLGISDEQNLLLYVGRLAQEKNMEFIFDAAAKVLEENHSTVFAVAGHGPHEEQLKQRAAELGEAGTRIHFLGTVVGQDLLELYSAADIFLFASKSETQGMVLVEAMAGGTPVVALDADAVRDIVKDEVNGKLLPGEATPDEFAAKLLEVIGSAKRQEKLKTGALESAEAFDMPKLAAQLLRHYRDLKLIPRHRLKREQMNFGLVKNYFSVLWQDLRDTLAPAN